MVETAELSWSKPLSGTTIAAGVNEAAGRRGEASGSFRAVAARDEAELFQLRPSRETAVDGEHFRPMASAPIQRHTADAAAR